MDQDTITKLTRRGIREPRPKKITDDEIVIMTLQGVFVLGMKIKELEPSFYTTHKSLNSRTNLFSKPSDCITVLRVRDLRTNAATITAASAATPIVISTEVAKTITAATNASPIVITIATHGYETGNSIFIGGILGNTGANGTFTITKLTANTFSLDDSTGTGAWTSGGIANKASLAHGFGDNNRIVVHDVAGNTDANGTFQITKSNLVIGTDENVYKCLAAHTSAAGNRPITGANYAVYWEKVSTGTSGGIAWQTGTAYILSDFNFSLDGSTGSTAWTSGGKAFKDPSNSFRPLDRITPGTATWQDETNYYLQGSNIVVDKRDFSRDLVIDYIKSPSAITDIPAEYHMGLVGFNVPMLANMPAPRLKGGDINPEFVSLSQSLQRHDRLLAEIKDEIDRSFEQDAENEPVPGGIDYDDFI